MARSKIINIEIILYALNKSKMVDEKYMLKLKPKMESY